MGRVRVVQAFPRQCELDTMTVHTDANWAGCIATRKSTSGCIISIGHHAIKYWLNTQYCVILSTAESEAVIMVK